MAGCDWGTATGDFAGTTGVVWKVWTTAATSCTMTGDPWVHWMPTTTTATNGTSCTTTIWYEWTAGGARYSTVRPAAAPAKVETEAEKAERLIRQAAAAQEAERKRLERAALKKEAHQRAEELLLRFLSHVQREMYRKEQRFHVVAADGQRYEVDCRAHHGNIYRLDDKNNRKDGYCIYQTGETPLPDNYLAQKFLLEADMDRFKKIANRFTPYGPRREAA